MAELSLEQVLARAARGVPVPVGCWVVARVAEALASAPRSVTPREVRVGDAGDIRLAPPRPGPTPFAYLAPEVVRGGDPDARSAVFGLGALLVELVTGAGPFARASDMETRLAIVEDSPPPLVGRVDEASGELDAIVQRALAKKPEARFASTSELAARIDRFLVDELHDIDGDRATAVLHAIAAGGSAADVRRAGFTPPELGGPVGEPSVRLPSEVPSSLARPTPPPGTVQPARRPTPSPGIVQPARGPDDGPTPSPPRAKPTPGPGIVQPARRPTPPPGVLEPARRPTPPPGVVQPAPPPPVEPRRRSPGPSYEDAELDLTPETGRSSSPHKPKLETVDRIGDPLLLDEHEVGAPLGQGAAPRQKPRPVALAIDEEALHRERNRPATVAPEEEDVEDLGRGWIKPFIYVAIALLAAAAAYQFLVRPLLG